jgi:hypothetical protein
MISWRRAIIKKACLYAANDHDGLMMKDARDKK